MNLKTVFARNIFVSWLGNAYTIATTLILTPLVIREVGSEAYGVWILINQIGGYAGILDLGIQPAVTKYVARTRAVGDRVEMREMISSALAIHTCIAFLILLGLFVLSFFLERLFHLGGVRPSVARRVLLIAGAGTALSFPANVLSGVLKGHLRIDLVNWIGIGVNTFRFLGVASALSWGQGIIGLAWVGLGANAIGLFGGLAGLYCEVGRGQIALRAVSKRAARSLFSFGVVSFIGTLGWYFSYASDALVIGATLKASDVAHFGLAFNIVSMLGSVVGALAVTIMPLASELEARGDFDRIRRIYFIGTKLTLLITLPLALVLLIEGPALLSIWVGPEFGHASGRVLRILTLAHLPIMMNGPGFQIALGAGLQRRVAVVTVFQGVLNVPLSFLLCRRLGVNGAALASLTVSLASQYGLWLFLFWSHYEISPRRFWSESLRPAFIPLIPAALVGLELSRVLAGGTLLDAVVMTLAMLVVYVSIALLTHGLDFIRPCFPRPCSGGSGTACRIIPVDEARDLWRRKT